MFEDKFKDQDYDFYQKVLNLSPAEKFILYILSIKKILNRRLIEKETLLPKRTIGTALAKLIKQGFIVKIEGNDLLKLPEFERKKVDYRETYYKIHL